MRLQIDLVPEYNIPYNKITQTHLQGLLYHLLNDTRYDYKHDENGFKYFTFSNIFPITNYKPGYDKKLIISSSSKNLIDTIYYKLKTLDKVKLHNNPFIIKKARKLKEPKRYEEFKTSTPIVLHETKKGVGEKDKYIQFKNNNVDINFFLKRLKENALKKYNSYTNQEYNPEGPIFTSLQFKREVAHSLRHHTGYRFLIIGSQWSYLKANPEWDSNFYKFIYEVGLGEKNSLGYGFINTL